MSSSLRVFAGAEAKRRIESEGFHLDLFDTLIGASGGPKWLTLYGLDRVLAPELAKRTTPIDLVGSSIGALRLTCYAQPDPGVALERFKEKYTDVRDTIFTPETITKFVYETARSVVGDENYLIDNPVRRLHVVVARCRGMADIRSAPMLSMLAPATANVVSPSLVPKAGIDRILFAADLSSSLASNRDYAGHRVQLSGENIVDVLFATGSIPGFVDNVRDIAGAPKGNYRDGGIVDYHFDPSWHDGDGLILYPHFSQRIVPGWFDKAFKSRHRDPSTWERLVVLAPSDEYVSRLPYGTIPDRKNGQKLGPEDLYQYWTQTADAGRELGDDLARMLEAGRVTFE